VSGAKRSQLAAGQAQETHWLAEREQLVSNMRQNVRDPRVLAAFRHVPRHLFVPEAERALAYRDTALPIGFGQTISQPSMIAVMLTALDLQPSDRVLEIGAGSGYAAALLSELANEVYAVEIVPELAARAASRLSELGYTRAKVVGANGREGLPAYAPYTKILVSAGAENVPPELARQLAPGGTLVIPVGGESGQTLLVGHKDGDGEVIFERSITCIFVPLVAHR
jgi:protein-L-isoaspartate(D-aspartate) O-methyltransferase